MPGRPPQGPAYAASPNLTSHVCRLRHRPPPAEHPGGRRNTFILVIQAALSISDFLIVENLQSYDHGPGDHGGEIVCCRHRRRDAVLRRRSAVAVEEKSRE